MVGVADRHIEPDHVVGERHLGVKVGRPRMVGMVGPDPGDAGLLSFFDGSFGAKAHHQMALGVVAVHQRHAGAFPLDPDIGFEVQAAFANSLDIGGQAENAVAVGAVQIGVRHQGRDLAGIALAHADGNEGAGYKIFQLGRRIAARLFGLIAHASVDLVAAGQMADRLAAFLECAGDFGAVIDPQDFHRPIAHIDEAVPGAGLDEDRIHGFDARADAVDFYLGVTFQQDYLFVAIMLVDGNLGALGERGGARRGVGAAGFVGDQHRRLDPVAALNNVQLVRFHDF